MEKPWYKSLKKWLGIIFSIAVLIGGMVDIKRNPQNTVSILQLWGTMAFAYLGITGVFKIGHKVVDNQKGAKGD